jgi:hypothetical protein
MINISAVVPLPPPRRPAVIKNAGLLSSSERSIRVNAAAMIECTHEAADHADASYSRRMARAH